MNQEISFGRFVREKRRALDLTQEELARRVGCAAITIRKIEADDARASVQIAERLAMSLGIPLDERAEFVRRARAVRPDLVESPLETPAPALDEIGREDLTGRAVRGYSLAERIGSGGMGAVYRAVQPIVEREVAMKIILPAYANHPDFIRRFEAEAQLVARLEHPHIVPLYDYWREPGVAYLIMRLLRGGSLHNMLQNGAIPLEATARFLEQICSALHSAHRIGVIHRDLKPANILLDEDQNAYLADFGIAKNLGSPNLEEQTQTDVIIGSPQYMSPEQIQSHSIRPQTDIYCLGVMLYEMLTGARPFAGPTPIELIQQHITVPLPPLSAYRTGLPASLDRVVGRAAAKNPDARYPDALALLEDFYQALDGTVARRRDALRLNIATEMTPVFTDDLGEMANPYKGLRAFSEADANDFFGRETLVQQLLARLGEGGDLARFLAVVGPSGSGKSSVVKAGLIPALRRGGLPGSENWFIVDLMPGSHPFEEVEAALLRIAVNPPPSLLAQLKENERGLVRAVRRCLPADDSVELVLVIDQFEELFTLNRDESERALFLSSLVAAVLDERSRVRVVLTMRADFTDRPLRYVDFGELVQRRAEFVLPLTPDELERAILSPAQKAGLHLENGLMAAMIRDAGDQPGTLPLVQYALTELFEKREESRTLTKAAYSEIGGILGALGRRAEELFVRLDQSEQAAARQLFLRLVTLGEGVEDTRRRVLQTELSTLAVNPPAGPGEGNGAGEARIVSVITIFGQARLLTFDHDPVTREPTVEVAHEALLREWGRLRGWLAESRDDIRRQRLLADAAAQWLQAGQENSYLLHGHRLTEFATWAETSTLALTEQEHTFLQVSLITHAQHQAEERARQERELITARQLAETERRRAEEQTRSANHLRRRNWIISAVGGVALILAVLAGVFSWQTENARQLAASRELASIALASLEVDPQLSLLLALESIAMSQSVGIVPLLEAQDALHRGLTLSRLEYALTGHSADITSVAFSPDGEWLATSSTDGTTRLWSTQTQEEIAVLSGHRGAVTDLAFSLDGLRLATVGDDTTLRLWDLTTFQATVIPTGHTLWVVSVAFNDDGTRLVTSSRDDTIKVWDVASGTELLSLTCGSNNDVTDAAYSPDGDWLVTTHELGAIGTWDANNGDLRTWDDGRRYILQDTAGGNWGAVLSVAFSANGKRFLTGHQAGMAKLWNLDTGTIVHTAYNHTGSVLDVVFSPEGDKFVTTSEDGTIKIWDSTTGRELITLYGNESGVVTAAFSPDGNYLATANGATAKVWDISLAGNREGLRLQEFDDRVTGLTYSLDGQQLVTTSGAQIVAWNVATGNREFKDVLRGGEPLQPFVAQDLALSPDGRSLAIAADDNTVRVWDLTNQEEIQVMSGHEDLVTSVAYSPKGLHLVTGSYDGTVRVWDTMTGETRLVLKHNATSPINDVAYHPNGEYLATGNRNGEVVVWNASTGELIQLWKGHAGEVSHITFSPNGQVLATAGDDGIIKIWDTSAFTLLSTLAGHRGAIRDLLFSPDSNVLGTASSDGTVKIWNMVASGSEPLTLYGDQNGVEGLAFRPDGKQLAAAGFDGSIQLYVLDIDELIALAESHITRTLSPAECQRYLHRDECPKQ